MELGKLLEGVEIRSMTGCPGKEIRGIAYHSKQVEKGFLFAAIHGVKVDGHEFIDQALDRGAEAILLEEGRGALRGAAVFVQNSRQALAKISSNFYGNPSAQVKLIGVTGTNGKTTITYLLESIFRKAGWSPGVIGTINYRYGQNSIQAPNTTPESLDLQKLLHEMVHGGVSHVVMEVSSHGLDLDRVEGCEFDGAIFTNLTSDHLDYHQTMGHYFESKKKLFSHFLMRSRKGKRFAVTNHDDPNGDAVVEGVDLPVFRYGLDFSCDISVDQVISSFEGLSCRMKTPRGDFRVVSKLIGRFNLYNMMAATAAGVLMDLPLSVLKDGIESLAGVPGRLEKVENGKGLLVIVDYAHTPDALERALLGVRTILEGAVCGHFLKEERLIVVFGCGGDRDKIKRPLMGGVAGRYGDLAILTSDNPRTEDPLAILADVERGLKDIPLQELTLEQRGSWRSRKGYLKTPDRREAIRLAIELAQPGDTILIAGKGHEDYQIIGTRKFPFDDRAEVKKALGET